MNEVSNFKCSISKQIMADPVVLSGDGHTYEREQITTWLQANNKSPLTNQSLTESGKTLIDNLTLRSMIQGYLTTHQELYDKDEVYLPTATMLAAIKESNAKKVAELFRVDARFLTNPLQDELTAFHLICQAGNVDMVKNLLLTLNEKNIEDIKRITAPTIWQPIYLNEVLLIAAKSGDITLATRCLELGADINAVDKETHNNTPLHWAVRKGDIKLAELFINRGARLEAKAIDDSTPLNFAGFYGRPDIAVLLISKGAKLHNQDINGNTPLHDAMANGHKEVISIFIQAGVNWHIKNNKDKTPLDVSKTIEIKNWSIEEKENFKAENNDALKRLIKAQKHQVDVQASQIQQMAREIKELKKTLPVSNVSNVLQNLTQGSQQPSPTFFK